MEFITKIGNVIPLSLQFIKPKVTLLHYNVPPDKTFFQCCVAIVGSRRMTSYGRRVLERLVPPLVTAGASIVSGFMYGVDNDAHRIALECGGKCIAVLGWGLSWVKLPVNPNFLIISEYEDDQKPQLWMFPKRNRIIAGLSEAVVVIEAGEKSGSIITADWAFKYGKKLYAVPGPITSSVSVGTNNLIQAGKAKILINANDVLKDMGLGVVKEPDIRQNKFPILTCLFKEPMTPDELAVTLHRDVSTVSSELSLLELQGLVYEENGKYASTN